MPLLTARALIALILVSTLTSAVASGPVIGLAVGNGSFQVDNSRVSGNATLFDGATVQTEQASSRIHLKNGVRMELAPASRAKVFARSVMLEQGFGELESRSDYQLEARTLKIIPGGPHTVARVRLDGDKKVLVAAINGPVRVLNSQGLLVARMNGGVALSFEPQAGAADNFDNTGCLLTKSGKTFLVDQSSQVFEVKDLDVSKHIGNRVHIMGQIDTAATPAASASQVVKIHVVDETATGGCLAVASQGGFDPPPTNRVGGPEPKSHTGAIIAGVAVAAAGGGIGAAIALGGKKSTSP